MVEHLGINNNEHDIYIDNHPVPPLMRGMTFKSDYPGAPTRYSPLSPFSGNHCLASISLGNMPFAGAGIFDTKTPGTCVLVDNVLVWH